MNDLLIAWRGPYDWRHLAGFLERRAIAGIESVDVTGYRRGGVHVRPDGRKRRFVVTASPLESGLEARVRRVFDVDADPSAMAAHLSRDPVLRPIVRKHPGIRVPGGWDPFEIAVRAIVGQQISVSRARTILESIAAKCGGLTADRIGAATLTGMPRRRVESLRSLAREVSRGNVVLAPKATLDETLRMLEALPGIGPWTANYVAMRGLGERDAFPAGDLILRRAAGNLTERELIRRAEGWRPYRAYAAMLLWAS